MYDRSQLVDRTIGTVAKNLLEGAVQAVVMSQPIEMRFNELLEGVKSELAVKIFGNDYDVLEKIAGEVKDILEKVPGAGEAEFEASGRVPMLDVKVNRAALVNYNLHASEVNRAIAVALGGQTVGALLGESDCAGEAGGLAGGGNGDGGAIRVCIGPAAAGTVPGTCDELHGQARGRL